MLQTGQTDIIDNGPIR